MFTTTTPCEDQLTVSCYIEQTRYVNHIRHHFVITIYVYIYIYNHIRRYKYEGYSLQKRKERKRKYWPYQKYPGLGKLHTLDGGISNFHEYKTSLYFSRATACAIYPGGVLASHPNLAGFLPITVCAVLNQSCSYRQ